MLIHHGQSITWASFTTTIDLHSARWTAWVPITVSWGRLDEAEMYGHPLQGQEKALGSNHPDTLRTVHGLGRLYPDQDKLDQAEAM